MSSFDGIAALLEKHRPPDRPQLPPADQIRLAVTKAAFFRPGKKVRTPRYVIENLRREYERQPSLQATADYFGLSKSHVFYLLKRHKVKLRSKPSRPRRWHNGLEYAFDGQYWWRMTKNKQGQSLHKVIWEEKHGPVPAGHKLILCGSPEDVENVRLVPLSEYYRYIVGKRWAKRAA